MYIYILLFLFFNPIFAYLYLSCYCFCHLLAYNYIINIENMYSVYVQCVCTVCMYSVYVQCICTVYMYSVYVQCICTVCMYSVYVQCICTVYMYSVYVQCICTVYMSYTLYIYTVHIHYTLYMLYALITLYWAAYRNLGQGGKLKLLNMLHGFMPKGLLSYQQETILNIWSRNPRRIYLKYMYVLYTLSFHNKIVKRSS